jgi:hypothetical protein
LVATDRRNTTAMTTTKRFADEMACQTALRPTRRRRGRAAGGGASCRGAGAQGRGSVDRGFVAPLSLYRTGEGNISRLEDEDDSALDSVGGPNQSELRLGPSGRATPEIQLDHVFRPVVRWAKICSVLIGPIQASNSSATMTSSARHHPDTAICNYRIC